MVRLAEAMFRPLVADGLDEAAWGRWRAACLAVTAGLPSERVGIFVVDHPEGSGALVACGAGVVTRRLPNPWHPEGLAGYVQWMSTEPDWRRRGLGRAVLRAVLGWLEDRGVDNVELHATAAGTSLYRAEGFWEGSGGLAMRRRAWDPPPGPR